MIETAFISSTVSGLNILCVIFFWRLKFNRSPPEIRWLEDEFPFWGQVTFQGLTVKLGGCT